MRPEELQFLNNHRARSNVELSRSSCLVFSVVCLLLCGPPRCPAQQSHAVQPSVSADTKAFQQLENRWSEAIGKRDQYALELVLSSEFVDVSSTGDVTTRNQQIAMLFEKGAEPLSVDRRVLNARIFGNLAVVIGTYSELQRVHGKRVIRSGVFTHVYQNARGSWLCIHAHRTAATEGALPETPGANSKTRSSASPPAPTTEHSER
jgi:hypothetical protein